MKKIRVYEIARRLNTKSNIVIKKLNDMGIEVKSNFSGVEEDKAEKFIEEWNKARKEAIKELKSKKKEDKKKKKKEEQTKQEQPKSRPHKKKEEKFKKKEFIEDVLPQKFKKRKKYKKTTKEEEPKEESNEIEFRKGMTVFEFANELGVDFSEVLSKLFELGILARKNDIIEEDAAKLIAEEYGFELKEEAASSELEEELLEIEDRPEDLKERPPIVTVMACRSRKDLHS